MIKIVIFITFILLAYSYNQTLAYDLCKLSVASYCKKAEVEQWNCAPCKNSPLKLNNVHTFENSSMDTLGYIGTSTELNAIVLAFRGTLPWDLKNWISDINFIAISYPICDNKCKVHRGFYYAFLDIQKQIMEKVSQYQTKFGLKRIVVTGHSLGAAISTHVVAHLIASKREVAEFYNFGSPRVGDKAFSSWFNKVYGAGKAKYRVTHGRDPVPHLPLEDWGFIHVPTEVFYAGSVKQGFKVCNDATAEDKTCSDKYKADVDIPDHISYYDIDFAGIILACQK